MSEKRKGLLINRLKRSFEYAGYGMAFAVICLLVVVLIATIVFVALGATIQSFLLYPIPSSIVAIVICIGGIFGILNQKEDE